MKSLIGTDMVEYFFCFECAELKCLYIIGYLYFTVYLALRIPYCHNAVFYSLFTQPS